MAIILLFSEPFCCLNCFLPIDLLWSLVYFCYLAFQLFSHKNLYEDDSSDLQRPIAYSPYLARKLRTTGDVEAASKEDDMPQTSFKMAIALLVLVTVVCQQLL